MHIKQFNPFNLTLNDVDKRVQRVKILIINDLDKILLCNINGTYSFVGGHVEEKESLCDTLYRELEEETGIRLEKKDVKPFYKIERWNINHFNTGKKCLSEIYYFYLRINNEIDLSNQKLNETEKQKKFSLDYVDCDKFEELLRLQNQTSENELYSEMAKVYKYLIANNKKFQKGRENDN